MALTLVNLDDGDPVVSTNVDCAAAAIAIVIFGLELLLPCDVEDPQSASTR
jgi:hypothetical protein